MSSKLVAFCAAAIMALAAFFAREAFVRSDTTTLRAPVVHAERAGLRLPMLALSDRVALVASADAVRWRIRGATEWRESTRRLLIRAWDTTKLPDGPYALDIRDGREARTQKLFIRNYTYLPPSLEGDESGGTPPRASDARGVVAAFARRSYRPGELAVLNFWRYRHVRIEFLHVGPEDQLTVGDETMEGVPVRSPVVVRGDHRSVHIRIGRWESGFYTARMTSGRKVGFAPFIVRPRRLGAQPVAVVLPTYTWQAYNFRDADGDGKPDTWYHTVHVRTVDLLRPYLDRGVPRHFRQNDLGFLRWLAHTGRHVDMLAQEDIERVSGTRLAQLYRLIIYPGHHEYVTEAEYDAVQRYRDLGGNLAFLSANNFYWRVDRDGNRITRIGLWRELGRPEAALVGVQYFTWNQDKFGSRAYLVRGVTRARWLFAGTGLEDGGRFAKFGIEADHEARDSPKSLRVLATIPHIFNARHAAEMTYYEAPSGARVFAAGAFSLAGLQARCATVARVLANMWDELAREPIREQYAEDNVDNCPGDRK
jgi:hypothetical protein